jgi:hypothetical protein
MMTRRSPTQQTSTTRCENCRNAFLPTNGEYECRANLPTAILMSGTDEEPTKYVAAWPIVSSEDWCGWYAHRTQEASHEAC